MVGPILEAVRAPRPSVSFEFFPPRDPAAEERLRGHVRELSRVAPDFVSVTYGAGGRAEDRLRLSRRVTGLLAAEAGAAAMAHLTLVGQTRVELEAAARAFGEAGAVAILALRGDPPDGPGGVFTAHPQGLAHATELIELLLEVLAEEGSTVPDMAVAAFPHGHPESESIDHDMTVLRAKQDAGAGFAITQMVFDAEPYRRLVDLARAAGVELPIVPGVMPVTRVGQEARLEGFSGGPLPAELRRRLAEAGSDRSAVADVGVAWGIELVAALLEAGAPGIHFYTLNDSTSSLRICTESGLSGTGGLVPFTGGT